MNKLLRNRAGFSVPELVIVILVIGALFGVGGYVLSKNATQRTTNAKTSPPIPAESEQKQTADSDPLKDWKTYTNNELGFTFKYPQEWGSASVSRKALNNEKYETNLPYVVSFSSADAPYVRIFPSDWKFNSPYPTEWRTPLTRQDLESYQVQVVSDQSKIIAISHSSFSGEINLAGLKSLTLTKLKATQIELHKDDLYDAKKQCLVEQKNKYGSMEKMATLDCYPETYRNNLVQFLDNFTVT